MKAIIAATDVTTETQSRDVAATTRTISRNVVEAVAALEMCSHLAYTTVTMATAAIAATARAASGDVRCIGE